MLCTRCHRAIIVTLMIIDTTTTTTQADVILEGACALHNDIWYATTPDHLLYYWVLSSRMTNRSHNADNLIENKLTERSSYHVRGTMNVLGLDYYYICYTIDHWQYNVDAVYIQIEAACIQNSTTVVVVPTLKYSNHTLNILKCTGFLWNTADGICWYWPGKGAACRRQQ